MFSKANELQEDISKKKYEFRTTQMHLAAFKSQVRIKKDSLFHCNFFFANIIVIFTTNSFAVMIYLYIVIHLDI